MSTDEQGAKAELRTKCRAILKSLSAEKRASDSAKLCASLKQHHSFQNAASILFFAPLPEEPDLWPLLNETLATKKLIALPCFDSESQTYLPRRIADIHVEIMSGKFGIREPAPTCIAIPLADLDLVLVPGVAFDASGRRLGRGKGYYDRLLQNFSGKKIGIAFDEQIVDAIPVEKNDVKVDLILTPTRSMSPIQH
ncbi:MAG TPA: 5-formyltetrahydrofolate cyclo-ligase [Pseudomonadales bacterium]|nr:5-formyltetrahydrofolate cyclo-ligase [Pseudomonadales bacterium]